MRTGHIFSSATTSADTWRRLFPVSFETQHPKINFTFLNTLWVLAMHDQCYSCTSVPTMRYNAMVTIHVVQHLGTTSLDHPTTLFMHFWSLEVWRHFLYKQKVYCHLSFSDDVIYCLTVPFSSTRSRIHESCLFDCAKSHEKKTRPTAKFSHIRTYEIGGWCTPHPEVLPWTAPFQRLRWNFRLKLANSTCPTVKKHLLKLQAYPDNWKKSLVSEMGRTFNNYAFTY